MSGASGRRHIVAALLVMAAAIGFSDCGRGHGRDAAGAAGPHATDRTQAGGGSSSSGSSASPSSSSEQSASPSSGADVAVVSQARASTPEPAGANVALDESGGAVESITGEYAGGSDGHRLTDGKPEPVWSWRGSALRDLPLDIVLSFYKRQPVLVTAVAIEMPPPPPDAAGKPNGNAPNEVEIWTSMQGADAGFEKVGSAALAPTGSPQTIAFPSIEARYVKVRVRSVQGPLWALSRVEIADIQVLEAQRAGYRSLLARHPELPDWKC